MTGTDTVSASLHLLRPFARWEWRGKRLTTCDEALEYVASVAAQGFPAFYTGTSRFPRRWAEMTGGSIYFVRAGEALFRMPFLRAVEDDPRARRWGGRHLIVMKSEAIPVESRPRVGFVRGWRYMQDGDAPPDMTVANKGDDLPAELRRHLDEIGGAL